MLAQQNADRGVVVFSTAQVVVHAHIHVHLADVLVAEFAGFQVYQHKAFEQVVVKHWTVPSSPSPLKPAPAQSQGAGHSGDI